MEARHFTAAGQVPRIASAGKVMATVFWDSEGVLMVDYDFTLADYEDV